MKNIFRLDSDKSGSVSFRELVTLLAYFRLTSFFKDIVPKWVSKSCTETEKCQEGLKGKWHLNNLKLFVTTLGISWKLPSQVQLLGKFSMMLIKIEMDSSLMLSISNSLKNTSVKLKPNMKEKLKLKLNHQSPLILGQKDSQDSEDGSGNNFWDFTKDMLVVEHYQSTINNLEDSSLQF